jgi:flagellar protein FliS
MTNAKQRQQYLATQIQTASKEQLVLMLMNGVIRFGEKGKKAIESGDIEVAHEALTRTQAIILELFYCLDREAGGEIAENLARLYTYSFQKLIEANMRKNIQSVEEVQKIFRELSEGWSGAMSQVKTEAATAIETTSQDTFTHSKPASAAQNPAPRPKIPAPAVAPENRPRLSIQG